MAKQIEYKQSVSGADYKLQGIVENEHRVAERSGALTITTTDISLNGKNEMGFELSRTYSGFPLGDFEINTPRVNIS